MSFLDYSGQYVMKEDRYFFIFRNQTIEEECCFIVPPVYDISFKKMFYYNNNCIHIVKNFLNSIIYPESNLIVELNFLSKEIISDSHLLNNKGTRRVDNPYLAKIKQYYDNSNNFYYKEVVIDLVIIKWSISDLLTEKCFDNGLRLRPTNNSRETWIIVLCLDMSKRTYFNKASNSYVAKKLNQNEMIKPKNYVKIYEIHLNSLYNDPNPTSVLNGETIDSEGKEWIKLFCLPLWCKSFEKNGINYYMPRNVEFIGNGIKKAFEILMNISDSELSIINMDKKYEERILQEKYQEGYYNRYQRFKNEGLDFFFEKFKSNKSMDNIEILGFIDKNFLLEKYGENPETIAFSQFLKYKGILVEN